MGLEPRVTATRILTETPRMDTGAMFAYTTCLMSSFFLM